VLRCLFLRQNVGNEVKKQVSGERNCDGGCSLFRQHSSAQFTVHSSAQHTVLLLTGVHSVVCSITCSV
jgi:thiamine phosphate synthase YjbQ (UPF0047 family)